MVDEKPIRHFMTFIQVDAPRQPAFLEVKTWEPGTGDQHQTVYFPAGDVEGATAWTVQQGGVYGVSVGTALRSGASGKDADCTQAQVLRLDLDHEPGGREAALARLNAFAIAPSMICASSDQGLYAFWRLDQPLDVSPGVGAAQFKAIQVGLARSLGGDVSSATVCKLLGIPGTVNRLTAKKRAAGREPSPRTILEHHPERVYTVSAFEQWELLGRDAAEPHGTAAADALGYGSTLTFLVDKHPALKNRFTRDATGFEGGSAGVEHKIDLSIAGTAARLGCCSGQIRELIEASRAAHGEAPASTDAIDRTIGIAFQDRPAHEHHQPLVIVNDREQRHVQAEVVSALSGANCRGDLMVPLYTRGAPVQLTHDDRDLPVVEVVQPNALANHLLASINLRMFSTRQPKAKDGAATCSVRPAPLPGDIPHRMLAMPVEKWEEIAPRLRGIMTTPIVRPDGSIRLTPGYDPETTYFYAAQVQVPPLPDTPTAADVAAAVSMLSGLFAEFRFDDEASRANTQAALLAPLVRPAIEGCVPPAIFDAAKAGSGKTLATDTIAVIAQGAKFQGTSQADQEEELDKRIFAAMMQGPHIYRIDNLGHELSSPHLCALFTSEYWEGRVLGRSQMARFPHTTCWYFTGNNVTLAGDMPRRVLYVRLDADAEQPWTRTNFRLLGNALTDHALATRGALLHAALTLVQHWRAQDCPKPGADVPAKGSFESWRNVVGGILGAAGIQGFLGNEASVYETVATEDADWGAFLAAWHVRHQETPVTTRQLIKDLDPGTEYQDGAENRFAHSAPDVVAVHVKRGDAKRLGKELKAHSGAPCRGYKLVRAADTRDGVAAWQVTRVS